MEPKSPVSLLAHQMGYETARSLKALGASTQFQPARYFVEELGLSKSLPGILPNSLGARKLEAPMRPRSVEPGCSGFSANHAAKELGAWKPCQSGKVG